IFHAEGQHPGGVPAALFKGADPIAQDVEPGRQAGAHEKPPVPKADECSCNVLVLYDAKSQPSLISYPLRRTTCGPRARTARDGRRWLFSEVGDQWGGRRRSACATSISSSCRSTR